MANSTTIYTLPDGRSAVDVSEAKTLAEKDCGIVQNMTVDALTVTLPATVVGYYYTIRNGGVAKTSGPARSGDDASLIVTITPNGSDKIMGMEMTSSDADTLSNTKATANVGDEVSLVGDGVNGWMVTNMKGTWLQTAA